MELIEREILNSREVLFTKFCIRNQFLFRAKFKPTREWVNKVNLSSFQLLQIRTCVISELSLKTRNGKSENGNGERGTENL